MANHGVDLMELEQLCDSALDPATGSMNIDMKSAPTATLILKVALHASDVSNPAKEWGYYNKWTERVLQEFHAQGDIERDRGIPISPGFDRSKMTNIKSKAGGQMFFIGVIVQPLFSVLSRLDNVDIDVAMDHLHENQAKWKQHIVDFDLEAAAEKEASAGPGEATEGADGGAQAEARPGDEQVAGAVTGVAEVEKGAKTLPTEMEKNAQKNGDRSAEGEAGAGAGV
mmetsp:Transcript_57957/g.160139  ORF Transcript_57957/g.160139 Transcript_57957/m.160139 type:complete len:227 (+) Transcript_57957:60-740(+)